jgi:hypothetical protein
MDDPSNLVVREHLRLPSLIFVVARIEVRERLSVGVSHDVTARYLVGAPGRREAA